MNSRRVQAPPAGRQPLASRTHAGSTKQKELFLFSTRSIFVKHPNIFIEPTGNLRRRPQAIRKNEISPKVKFPLSNRRSIQANTRANKRAYKRCTAKHWKISEEPKFAGNRKKKTGKKKNGKMFLKKYFCFWICTHGGRKRSSAAGQLSASIHGAHCTCCTHTAHTASARCTYLQKES